MKINQESHFNQIKEEYVKLTLKYKKIIMNLYNLGLS